MDSEIRELHPPRREKGREPPENLTLAADFMYLNREKWAKSEPVLLDQGAGENCPPYCTEMLKQNAEF